MTKLHDALKACVPGTWAVIKVVDCYLFVAPDRTTRFVLTFSYGGGEYDHLFAAVAHEPDSAQAETYDLEHGLGEDHTAIVDAILPHVWELDGDVYTNHD